MIEEDLKRILQDSTLAAQLCTNPILVRKDEIDKASLGEKKTDTSSMPPTSTETKVMKGLHGITTGTHVSMPIVVYQVKGIVTLGVNTLELNALMQVVLRIKMDGTQVHIGQEVNPTHISEKQGEVLTKEKEANRNEESFFTTNLEEHIAIQKLVTLLVSTIHIPIQTLYRPSIDATPLQSSRPSPNTSKIGEGISYGDANLNEVIKLPKFYFQQSPLKK